MIRDTLTLPPHTVKSDFSLGLVWIESIPKQEAVELLQQNLKQVEESLAQWHAGKEIKGQYGLSKIAMATFDNAISILEQDIIFLNKIIALVQE